MVISKRNIRALSFVVACLPVANGSKVEFSVLGLYASRKKVDAYLFPFCYLKEGNFYHLAITRRVGLSFEL